jgi:hypothetical protein
MVFSVQPCNPNTRFIVNCLLGLHLDDDFDLKEVLKSVKRMGLHYHPCILFSIVKENDYVYSYLKKHIPVGNHYKHDEKIKAVNLLKKDVKPKATHFEDLISDLFL